MVSFLTEAIFCALISLSIASAESPAIRATNSAVPLPTPPSGSRAVFVNATDPGINWSTGWQTGPSSCSSGTVRTVSANGIDELTTYTASYNFRGTGIYANLESGDAFFSISIDGGEQETFGFQSGVVPANCSYDYSKTNLADDTHVFSIMALGPSIPDTDSFWTLSVGGLVIIQPNSDSSPSDSTDSAVPLPTPPPGSKLVVVNATDPGINWSTGWQTGPSSCSSGTVRTVSANGIDELTTYTASYNFRGTGIYANLQSGNAFFSISIDSGEQKTFGYQSGVVPANCSYDYSKTNLADDTHVFSIMALGPSIPDTDSFWTLSVGGLAIIQPGSGSDSDSSSSDPTVPAQYRVATYQLSLHPSLAQIQILVLLEAQRTPAAAADSALQT
ncbi:hypothetical protein GGX14DRAFT_673750 [Mycena pura]|uniref:Uncharacterized protein n=1 Tax=Mycena pura TaxID=153505 RepID=A0AAD6Y4E2_9AGAR|nr:hypothetical protein GGX14DRAFT_673750 [Mycena pura]